MLRPSPEKGAAGNKKDVDKPDVLPAMRGMNEGNPAASRGLPPGAYDPKKDDSTKELLKTNTPEQTNRKEVRIARYSRRLLASVADQN